MGRDSARNRERKRLKRERKRREGRRGGMLAEVREAARGELAGCYVNENWREWGQAGVFVARRWKGRLALAGFFVDLWCAGVKDAWAKVGAQEEDFEQMLEISADQFDADMVEVTVEEAGRIVAGGLRFAKQNGFRWPEQYERAVAYLGAVDVDGADISAFGIDEGGKKLRWVGPEWDLRRRLVGTTVEEFLKRPDVEAHLDVEGGMEEEFSDEELAETAEAMDGLVKRTVEHVRAWCAKTGAAPEPELEAGVSLFLTAGFQSLIGSTPEELGGPEASEQFMDEVETLIDTAVPEADRGAVARAVEQVLAFTSSEEGQRKLLEEQGEGGEE